MQYSFSCYFRLFDKHNYRLSVKTLQESFSESEMVVWMPERGHEIKLCDSVCSLWLQNTEAGAPLIQKGETAPE